MRPGVNRKGWRLSRLRSAQDDGVSTPPKLEMEEQCQNTTCAPDSRESVRVVRSVPWAHAAPQLVERRLGSSTQTDRAVPPVSPDRGLRVRGDGMVLAIEACHSTHESTAPAAPS